jgi:hypothetical protein
VDPDVVRRDDADQFAEIVRYYDLWRQIASLVGEQSYDEADWENGRLYFRSDYMNQMKQWPEAKQFGDWAAWIIEPTPDGYYNVLRSLKHEREKERSDEIEVVFSQITDAGKYIILQIGDARRLDLKLETLFMKWDAAELDPRIQIAPAGQKAVDYLLKRSPGLRREFAEQHLQQYTLRDDASSFGLALPSRQTDMQVLALSYDELNALLLDGMPESITARVSDWAEQLGIGKSAS